MDRSRVRRSLTRLTARDLVGAAEGSPTAYTATETGRVLARDWAMAVEVAGFEP